MFFTSFMLWLNFLCRLFLSQDKEMKGVRSKGNVKSSRGEEGEAQSLAKFRSDALRCSSMHVRNRLRKALLVLLERSLPFLHPMLATQRSNRTTWHDIYIYDIYMTYLWHIDFTLRQFTLVLNSFETFIHQVVRSKEASFIRLNSSLAWLQALQAMVSRAMPRSKDIMICDILSWYNYMAWDVRDSTILRVREANGLSFDRFYLGLGGLQDIFVRFRTLQDPWKACLGVSSLDVYAGRWSEAVRVRRTLPPQRRPSQSKHSAPKRFQISYQFSCIFLKEYFRIAILHRIAVLPISWTQFH